MGEVGWSAVVEGVRGRGGVWEDGARGAGGEGRDGRGSKRRVSASNSVKLIILTIML